MTGFEPVKAAGRPAFDPLLCRTELPLHAEFYPLGFPLTIRTNSALVLEASQDIFARFPRRFPTPHIEARILVADDGPLSAPVAPVFRAQGNLLTIISDAANFAACDLASGFAFCWVTPAAVADRDFMRFHFLEAIAYTLLGQLCVTPVHASCVAWKGIGVLLCGAGGAGKSSLAYACAQRGWTLVSDNTCYVVDGTSGPVVAGRPQYVRIRETAVDLFPELERLPGAANANGKISLEIHTGNAPRLSTAFDCPAGFLIFLERRGGRGSRLVRLSQRAAFQRLARELPRYRYEVEERHRASIINLLQADAFELRYQNLEEAIERLEGLVSGK